jgi:hypothetical protein
MPTGLWHDERAIEGLPVRLVIALVVGVASLAVMMNVIAGLDAFGSTELDTQPEPEIIESDQTTVNVTVVDPDGEGIVNATVVASGDTATLPSIVTAETGANGTATLELDPELGPNQERGTLTLDVRPPEGDYVDEQENTNILVVEG